jgi:type II secretory pathway pseudopilin PulG
MMEIAISLAVIGIALVAIIGVLPMGMNVQQTNRQETVIGQDATVFMNAIRNGALGYDDLTNYVYAITNYWTQFAAGGTVSAQGVNGYTYALAYNAPGYPPTAFGERLTNGANIIGLMTEPEYIGGSGDIGGDRPGQPIPCLMYGGISNHVVAYCHSISGPAVEKPPQDNPILQQDAFGYRLFCVNAPEATDTNMFAPLWKGGNLGPGPLAAPGVFYGWTYWNLPAGVFSAGLTPGINPPFGGVSPWQMTPDPGLELALNLHELRLTFEWPQLPNGKLGPGRETFRTEVAGELQHQPSYVPGTSSVYYNPNLYCYQAQIFTNTP